MIKRVGSFCFFLNQTAEPAFSSGRGFFPFGNDLHVKFFLHKQSKPNNYE